jgi:hypothetical protein
MSVTLLNVLNTVTALGVDARVDANGFLSLQGSPAFKTSNIDSVVITPYVAEVAQVSTVTISTVSNNAIYSLSLICNDVNSGMITSVPLTVTSDSTATNTEIAAAFAAAINGMPELSVTATSSTTLVVTAKAGFPIFTLATSDTKLSISTSAGTVGVGTGTSLISTYPSTAGYFSAGGFNAAASIVATNNYTQVLVLSRTGGSAVILVNEAATNYPSLLGTFGTLKGLQAGYRVTGVAITGTAGTNTTNVQTMTSGVLGTEDVVAGDYIVGDAGSLATNVRKVISTLSQTTFLTTTATAITGSSFSVFKWRALPL